ncbi:hypothetical protein [Clostridium saccharoperbutylacetonicum]
MKEYKDCQYLMITENEDKTVLLECSCNCKNCKEHKGCCPIRN